MELAGLQRRLRSEFLGENCCTSLVLLKRLVGAPEQIAQPHDLAVRFLVQGIVILLANERAVA